VNLGFRKAFSNSFFFCFRYVPGLLKGMRLWNTGNSIDLRSDSLNGSFPLRGAYGFDWLPFNRKVVEVLWRGTSKQLFYPFHRNLIRSALSCAHLGSQATLSLAFTIESSRCFTLQECARFSRNPSNKLNYSTIVMRHSIFKSPACLLLLID